MKSITKAIYYPCIRAGKYDLLALKEIEEHRRPMVAPIISARGADLQPILEFAQKWGDNYYWIDSSRFAQDTQDPLSSKLNNYENNFSAKLEAFLELKKTNKKTLPVLGFSSGDNQRSAVQFGLKLLREFPLVALRIEGAGAVLDRNLSTARAFLNAISDDDFDRTVLIIDSWSISEMPSLQEEGSIKKAINLTHEYPIKTVITLSTSWPDDRPERGANTSVSCIDPLWQAIVKSQLGEIGVQSYYGDYAATNPMKDLLDDYDPTKMSQPIPFAGYYNLCSWYQERRGAGGENEKYREIAQSFRTLANYHGDEFCWGTKAIAAIATNKRDKSGNMAFWNKIRINQHICSMIRDLDEGMLDKLLQPPLLDDDDDYDDLI